MRLLRNVAIAAIALAVACGIALWTCPAALAYRLLQARLAPLSLAGLSGTLWHGHADDAELFGQKLGTLDWTLHAAPLLAGDVVAAIDLRGTDFSGTGLVLRAADGRLELRDAAVRIPARLAAPALAIPALDLLGTIEIDLAHARVFGAGLADAAGTAHWRDAAVAGAAQAKIGDLEATFASTADGAIAGDVRDRGGPLEVAGSFTASLGRYQAQARLALRGDNPQLAEALQYIGQPQPDGSRQLLIEGRQLQLF